MNASHGASPAMVQSGAGDRLAGLTALRGIAAMMVVLVHVRGIHKFEIPGVLGAVIPHMSLGVPLFFVISAFSLYISTTPRLDRPGWLQDYVTRRFMRIAPLFYVMCLFFILVVPELTGGPRRWGEFILSLTFLFNFMPEYSGSVVWAGWSVGIEMVFYLILPVLLVTVRGLRLAAIIAVAGFVVSSAFVDYYRKNDFPENFEWFSLFGSLGIFGAGILAHELFQRLRSVAKAELVGLVCLALAAVLGTVIVFNWTFLSLQPVTMALWWSWPFGLLVVSQCLRPVRLIANPVFADLGELSFSLYLLHPPIIYFSKPIYLKLFDLAGDPRLGYGLSVFVTLAILYPAARFAYWAIERPGILWGERIIAQRRELKASAVPV